MNWKINNTSGCLTKWPVFLNLYSRQEYGPIVIIFHWKWRYNLFIFFPVTENDKFQGKKVKIFSWNGHTFLTWLTKWPELKCKIFCHLCIRRTRSFVQMIMKHIGTYFSKVKLFSIPIFLIIDEIFLPCLSKLPQNSKNRTIF